MLDENKQYHVSFVFSGHMPVTSCRYTTVKKAWGPNGCKKVTYRFFKQKNKLRLKIEEGEKKAFTFIYSC